MPYHGVSLSGINASRFKDYVIPPIKYLGSNVPDGSTDISAVSARDITLNFDQSVDKLSVAEAAQLGIATPTLTITATPKDGDTQTLVENTDFSAIGRRLVLYKDANLSTSMVDKFGFDGLTKDNVFDYFTNSNFFYTNAPKPDTTYTITYSPNYYWNKSTGILYDKEISITFTTRPVQTAFTLEVKRDMVQGLANVDENGIASLMGDRGSYRIHYRVKNLNTLNVCMPTQGRTDATSELYDYAVSRFSRYRIVDLSEWDSSGYANWYTGLPEGLRPTTAIYAGTTYAATGTGSTNGRTYHYYDIHMEVW